MLAKIEKVLSKVLGGSSTERELKRIQPIADEINHIAEEYKNLTDDELKAKTNEFRYRLKMGETIDDLLPEAFAAVKDTCRRLLGKRWMVRAEVNAPIVTRPASEHSLPPFRVLLVGIEVRGRKEAHHAEQSLTMEGVDGCPLSMKRTCAADDHEMGNGESKIPHVARGPFPCLPVVGGRILRDGDGRAFPAA